jgi:very-short-patch-repair endonuclease
MGEDEGGGDHFMLPLKQARSRAKDLRKNMTDAEQKLWFKLRKKQLGVKFRRQQLIGRYIVDFVCYERKIIIEVDGGQHNESPCDEIRDRWFIYQGYKVLRFWNNDVLKNIEGVIEMLLKNISPFP